MLLRLFYFRHRFLSVHFNVGAQIRIIDDSGKHTHHLMSRIDRLAVIATLLYYNIGTTMSGLPAANSEYNRIRCERAASRPLGGL